MTHKASIHSAVKYDLIGKIAEATTLTRKTVASILSGMNIAVFSQYKTNPEDFIHTLGAYARASRSAGCITECPRALAADTAGGAA
ncbi:MAG: hypothetical protein KDJ29_11745 [Hyphomicrobiales bacterium]|nr:hypothetical protein [Hyphomicrobiales bacterium]